MKTDQNKIKKIFKNKITSIKQINTGVSNSNYLINDKYVIRIKGLKDHFYLNKNEKEVLNKISSLNISEKVILLDKAGNKISRYISNANIFKGENNQIIKAAHLIKKLHSCKKKINTDFKPFLRFNYYKSFYKGKAFTHELYVLKETKKIYKKYPLVICHNDLVDNNFLYTKNKSYLIDYEFAGKNIPLFDLASFISENNISNKKKIDLFLKSYGFKGNKKDLKVMVMFLNLLWFYWAIERYQISKRRIFKDIAKVKLEHIKLDIKSLNELKINYNK